MKLAVCSYSLCQLRNRKEKTELELLQVAKDLGFNYFEFSEINVPEGKDKIEYAKELKAEADKVGINVVQYSIGADFYYGSDGDLDKEIERLKGEIDVAEALGVVGVRHDTCSGPRGDDSFTFKEVLPRIVKGCKAVTEYAKTKGIKTMTENHGFFCQDSERIVKIIEGVSDENFGTLIDIGNYLCADEYTMDAVKNTAKYASYVHCKDFHIKSKDEILSQDAFFQTRGGNFLRGAVLGHGDVPVYEALKYISENGYDSYVTLEFEGVENCIDGCSWGLNTLKLACDKIGVKYE